jgi:NAD-dependent dihydropyrimidine dehydrogenase PreA subunit
MGAKGSPHYIIDDKCIACGRCGEVCPADAVLVD